jgi:pimeloyl-ACP methyl ester carboxylesterase
MIKKEQRTLKIFEHEIWTEALGNPQNPAVLLISGAAAHARFWTDLFCHEIVKSGYYVIRYDHRDVGLSSTFDYEVSPYKVEDLAADAAEILNAYGLEKAHLVGHSMGGIIVQLLASEYPEKVLSLVCMCTGPAGATTLTDSPLTAEEKAILDKTREINMANISTLNFEEGLPRYMRMWERWNGTLPLDQELALQFTRELFQHKRPRPKSQPDHPHIQAVRAGMATMEHRRELFKKIHAPTLIIQGEEDYLLVPRRGGIALAEVLPQGILKMIPGMGHMFFNKDTQKMLAKMIVDFFVTVT